MDPHEVDLFTTTGLQRAGRTSRQVAALVDSGAFIRLRRGVFAASEQLTPLRPEARMIVRARAWQLVAKEEPRFSHLTAGAAHGLPVFRSDTRAVHTLVEDPRSGAVRDVVRHRSATEQTTIMIRGMLCTPIEQTVADIARLYSPETSLAAADAALRRVAWDSSARSHSMADYRDPYCVADAESGRSRMLDAVRRGRGAQRAERVLGFADGRADGPGESLSRLYLVGLGFARPNLQVALEGPDGSCLAVDFDLDDVGAFGEFDGQGKYTDPRLLRGRTTQQALLDEKRREDWIRGVTQRRFARWGMEHVASPEHLARRLAFFSIRPPAGRGGWGA